MYLPSTVFFSFVKPLGIHYNFLIQVISKLFYKFKCPKKHGFNQQAFLYIKRSWINKKATSK